MKTIVGRTTEDVATLPRWARQRIERLTQETENWKTIALAATTPGKTNVTLVDGLDERGLPPNSRVRFGLGKDTLEVGIRADSLAGSGAIEVRCLDGNLSVLPAVANVIYVKVDHR